MHHQWLLLAACFWVIFMFMVASKFITLTFKDPDGMYATLGNCMLPWGMALANSDLPLMLFLGTCTNDSKDFHSRKDVGGHGIQILHVRKVLGGGRDERVFPSTGPGGGQNSLGLWVLWHLLKRIPKAQDLGTRPTWWWCGVLP